MLSNSNLSQIWEEEITTSDWEWIEAELKPGEQGYHYIVNLTTKELDPSEPYPVALDFKSVDVRTASPGYDAIRELLDESGYEQWDEIYTLKNSLYKVVKEGVDLLFLFRII